MVTTTLRASLIALLASAAVSVASADTAPPDQTRATIRGSGKDITIVYRGAATATTKGATAPRLQAPARENDVLAEAVKQASRGADDESLIAYLRVHQADLPPVTGADVVRKLRKAGASERVVSYLSRVTALDIGETAQDVMPMVSVSASAPGDAGYPMMYSNGYPFYGSNGFPSRRHHFGSFPSQRPVMLPGQSHGPARPPMHGRMTPMPPGAMARFLQP